ncbi:TonB family C-terminal domain-containing protein [Allopseudospirillum japonicum]|uniref:Protein TonB n=2 Tax=Allopseudospirillum japonicum TaxID=64971 RepID=A0A1H6SEM4_9GAMM|nr:TonB family C-terminal domain-containing protein [Allopseudospirillum japonicum]
MRVWHPYQPWLIGLAFLFSLMTHAWAVLGIAWQDPLVPSEKTSPRRTQISLQAYQIPQPSAAPSMPVKATLPQTDNTQKIVHTTPKSIPKANAPVKKIKGVQPVTSEPKPVPKKQQPIHSKTSTSEQTPSAIEKSPVTMQPAPVSPHKNIDEAPQLELEQAYYQALIQHLSEYKHYPMNARRRGIEGTVELKIRLNAEGALLNIEVLKSTHPWLQKAAIESVQQALPFQKVSWVFAQRDKDFLAVFDFYLN